MSQKIKLVLIFSAILISLNLGFIALYFSVLAPSQQASAQPKPITSEAVTTEKPSSTLSDEYYSIHFSYNDAIDLCMAQARSRNSNLIQITLNDLSSRYKPEEQLYLIKLDSHVGTPLLYDEKSHTCEVDPKTQGVAFYREITRKKAIRP